MQLVFYRADEFKSFSGINIMNKEERDRLIDMQLNLLLLDKEFGGYNNEQRI